MFPIWRWKDMGHRVSPTGSFEKRYIIVRGHFKASVLLRTHYLKCEKSYEEGLSYVPQVVRITILANWFCFSLNFLNATFLQNYKSLATHLMSNVAYIYVRMYGLKYCRCLWTFRKLKLRVSKIQDTEIVQDTEDTLTLIAFEIKIHIGCKKRLSIHRERIEKNNMRQLYSWM